MSRGRGDLRRTIVMFRRFSVGQRRSFVFAGLLLAVEAGTAVLAVGVIGYLLDFLIGGKPALTFAPTVSGTIAVVAGAFIALTAVNSLTDSLAEISLAKAGRTIGYNLRTSLFAHLQKLSLAFHLRRRTGDVLTRITSDVNELEEFVVKSASDLAGSVLLLSASLIYLSRQSVPIMLLALGMVPILASVSNGFASRIKAASKQLRAREGDLASAAQEMLASISVVQTYGRSGYEERRFAEHSRGTMAALMRTARLEAAFSFTVSVLESIVIASVIWIATIVIGARTIPPGTLVACILIIQNMFKPTRRIIKEWNTVGKLYASVERIGDLLARTPAVQDAPGAVATPPMRGAIEFRHVSFVYQPGPEQSTDTAPTRLDLDDISFTVAPGEVVALVGHSGAGKSTIAQLLPRLYDPHAGAVLLDGHDIREFTLDSLRAQISMVLQDTVLFSGTILENIRYGREDATFEDVVAAARQANAHEFITAMPDGYETVLGERAATLSGGQRQRLAIARAFVRNAPVLVLDEPTTGLDAESSGLVRRALQTLVRGTSTLIISHDFNLIRDADRILAISAGRILEEGTPADLLARGGLYADLYARQFGEEMAALDGEDVPESERRRAFESVMLEAMPLPASPEAFRRLTGREATPVPAAPGEGDLDPLRSESLRRALPGLPQALDATAISPGLQELLADDWVLDWCAPGKVLVEPREGATLRYRVGVRHTPSGRVAEHLIGARMFLTRDHAEDWAGRTLASLRASVDGREDLRPFARVFRHVAPLNLVVHAFPLDPDLPGLPDATDPARLPETVGAVLAGTVPDLQLQGCTASVVQYARRGRCVLRYELIWRLGATSRTVKQVVYGKVYGDESGRLVGPALDAVRGYVTSPANRGGRFLVPRFHGYLPDLRLVLLEALPGAPRLPALVRERVTGTATADARLLTLEAALDACARIAATLHSSGIELGRSRTLSGDAEAARWEVAAIAGLAPAVAATLAARLDDADAVLADDGSPFGLTHGDFTPAQVLFDGPLSGLVDLDTMGLAEPALDLGQFVGYLALAVRKAQTSSGRLTDRPDDLGDAFLDGYVRAAGVPDAASLTERVAAYRTVTLVRIAARSWRQLKASRLRLALDLLEERRPSRNRVSS